MGKNRTSRSPPTNPTPESTYTSDFTDEEVPLGNLTEEEMMIFNDKADDWLHYYSENPDEDMTMKEMEYIFSHFHPTENNSDVPDGHLYRFENAYHFDGGNYNVGDKIDGTGSLRSFSRDIESTNHMLDNRFNNYSNITIYRTVGNAPYFDVGKHANPFPYQKECLVPLDTMRIQNISRHSGINMRDEIYSEYGIDLGDYEDFLYNVTVVDVAYDPKVTSVEDTQGRNIRTEHLI